ncbi:M20/M25/M40 family metallo-hydrolase [Robiginitalea sp.]|uniref:M20/M25/M40 family metallo-hydrolase n=1 Tax=Robiginitalea sp. TaxID=1902411 RepID=UPI003C70F9A4
MKKLQLFTLLLYLSGFTGSICAQATVEDAEYWRYAKASFPQLKELLAIPNDAHFPKEIERNVQWCERHFTQRGFRTQRLETPGAPLLMAERKTDAKGAKTVLIYLQVDGQPVDPKFWNQEDPYTATLKKRTAQGEWEPLDWSLLTSEDIDPEWRIFARSTSDSKGAVNMFLTAVDMIDDRKESPNFNIKVIMDFEEEMGSPNLPQAVREYKEALAADMLIIFDGPRHIANKPTLTFGARGISEITLTVFGPNFPQHSGHYGNWAPNPAVRMSQLIASMKDENERVTIPGFYDGISISEKVKKVLDAVPDHEDYINKRLGVARGTGVAPTYQESLQYPSLNVRGFSSGWVGAEARTIVPATATAEIDIRLVVESDPDRLIELVRDHIIGQGYYVIDRQPTAEERETYPRICQFTSSTSYLAFRTDFDSEVGLWLDRALTRAFGETPIKQRTSGGSIPISPFVSELGVPAVTVPTVNRDNNQHSPNENIRIGNYVDGIKTIHYIFKEAL